MNIGYCCINISLNEGKNNKNKIYVNRSMTKKTFEKKGLEYVSELAIKNINDFERILKWNVQNNIFVYRMSSDMFPCIGFYNLENLPNFDIISLKLQKIGCYSKNNNIRLSFHPSHFCVIASENNRVIENSIDELNKHAQIMDLIGLEKTNYYPINVHVNTINPNKELASDRFCKQFYNLSESCQKRLVVENDDGPNQYSTKNLYELIYKKIGIPITHDFHHHNYGYQDISQEKSLELAISTWNGVKPLTHMSSSKMIENPNSKKTAHADYIYEEIKTFGFSFDVEIEAKCKDLAVLKYRNQFN